jgi:hypothetical protein
VRQPPMIETCGLAKSFRRAAAVRGLNLQIPAGTTFCLLGPNGAGKTTVVRMLSTLVRPDAGWARVAGFDVAADGAAVRREIGLSGQYASVDEFLTGRANLVMIGELCRLRRPAARRRAADLLATSLSSARPIRSLFRGQPHDSAGHPLTRHRPLTGQRHRGRGGGPHRGLAVRRDRHRAGNDRTPLPESPSRSWQTPLISTRCTRSGPSNVPLVLLTSSSSH